jgi:NhaA family Na+:H+ antiporter
MEQTNPSTPTKNKLPLPKRPVERLLSPVRRFLHIESASGVALLVCTAVALGLANSPFAAAFAALWHTHVELAVGGFRLAGELGHLVINDGLMTIFFFVVGLEIKREIVAGELRDVRKATLPIFAALGGMIAPALVYLAMQWGQPGQRGWAVPMATDIAFVVGVLALFGPRVPFSLKILLLSLAIVDDLGAVLIIAFVLTGSIAWTWLAAAATGFAIVMLLNRIGVRAVEVYVMVGAVIWLAVYESGVHPTVAGVLLGLLTPSSAWVGDQTLFSVVGELWNRLQRSEPTQSEWNRSLVNLQFAAREAVSPLQRLETSLHPWVAFIIMPVFALANAGVALEPAGLREPVAMAVAAGLIIGKPVGILFFCWLSVRLKLSALPHGVSWSMLAGGACLAGIGFTMALFINGLTFPPDEFPGKEAAGKIGTLLGSLVSAIVGASILIVVTRRKPKMTKQGD